MVVPEQSTQLELAARLLKAGNRTEAYRLLKTLVHQTPDDWRVWWGLAHATSNATERIAALKKTIQLNPQHPKAAALLEKAQLAQPASPPVARPAPAPAAPPPPSPQANPFEAQPFPEAIAPREEVNVFENPFAGYEVAPSRQNTWEGPVGSSLAVTGQASMGVPLKKKNTAQVKSRSTTDLLINIAIAVLALLVVGGLAAIVLPRIDFSSLIPGGPPNHFTSPDENFRTSGGGKTTINGPAVQDRIDGLFEAHNWVFEATAGQTVTIDVEAIGDTDPRLRLLDPDGSLLAEDDDSGYDYGMGIWDATLVYTFSRDGVYTLRIDVFIGGDFTIRVYE